MRVLNLDRRQAKKLRSKYEPNSRKLDIIKLAETEGVRVLKKDFDDDISGLLLKTANGYVIGVNSKHPLYRQRFTIAHELGHFILHKEEVIHYDTEPKEEGMFFRANGEISNYETEANHFAAELLMPEDMVRQDFEKTPVINKLKDKYGVSDEAMKYRLVNLGLL
jgi:Zn-dependent peptidase ImmA (M78 family)